MFRDQIKLKIKSGKGGDGLASFDSRKRPNGGIGGDGGDFYVQGTHNLYDFSKLNPTVEYKAEDGEPGGYNNCEGAKGEDYILRVPLATQIYNQENKLLYKIEKDDAKVMILKGGRGGLGNHFFKAGQGQTLYKHQQGKPAETAEFFFELELMSDIIFIGLPNVGKSSVLRKLTNADAKVAAYPFTTLLPQLGICDGMILMDLPGLIEGTYQGRGVGTKFVKHTRRAKLLAHFISLESDDLYHDYEIIREELTKIGEGLDKKPEVIIFTKADLFDGKNVKQRIKDFREKRKEKKGKGNYMICSVNDDDSLKKLRSTLRKMLIKKKHESK